MAVVSQTMEISPISLGMRPLQKPVREEVGVLSRTKQPSLKNPEFKPRSPFCSSTSLMAEMGPLYFSSLPTNWAMQRTMITCDQASIFVQLTTFEIFVNSVVMAEEKLDKIKYLTSFICTCSGCVVTTMANLCADALEATLHILACSSGSVMSRLPRDSSPLWSGQY